MHCRARSFVELLFFEIGVAHFRFASGLLLSLFVIRLIPLVKYDLELALNDFDSDRSFDCFPDPPNRSVRTNLEFGGLRQESQRNGSRLMAAYGLVRNNRQFAFVTNREDGRNVVSCWNVVRPAK